jgi:hypothetical protein
MGRVKEAVAGAIFPRPKNDFWEDCLFLGRPRKKRGNQNNSCNRKPLSIRFIYRKGNEARSKQKAPADASTPTEAELTTQKDRKN